jgi:hypothetical protein
MLDINPTTLAAVVDKALADAADHPRWLNAISRAVTELVSNPWIERQHAHAGLIIGSPSGNCYSSNGICGCCAYTGIDPNTGKRLHQGGQPCWHRAAARLVRLHDQRQQVSTIDALDGYRHGDDIKAAKRRAYEQACREMDELYA